jgi:hypothetical protein
VGPGELLTLSQETRQKKKISQRPVTAPEENKSSASVLFRKNENSYTMNLVRVRSQLGGGWGFG